MPPRSSSQLHRSTPPRPSSLAPADKSSRSASTRRKSKINRRKAEASWNVLATKTEERGFVAVESHLCAMVYRDGIRDGNTWGDKRHGKC